MCSASQEEGLGLEQHIEKSSQASRVSSEPLEGTCNGGKPGGPGCGRCGNYSGSKEAARLEKVPLGSGASHGFKSHAPGPGRARQPPPRLQEGTVRVPVLSPQCKEVSEAARQLLLVARPPAARDRGCRSVASDFPETERPVSQRLANNCLEGILLSPDGQSFTRSSEP